MVGFHPRRKDIELMIWEVDEDLDQVIDLQ